VPRNIFLRSKVFVHFYLLFVFSCSAPSYLDLQADPVSLPNEHSKISLDLSKKLDSQALLSSSNFKVAVKLKKNQTRQADTLGLAETDLGIMPSYTSSMLLNVVFAELSKAQILELSKNDNVELIEEDYIVKTNLFYATKQIGARQAWLDSYVGDTLGSSSQKIRLAVIDTGIDDDHLDFDSRIIKKINCYQTNPCASTGYEDDNGHGTHVAGIMLGSGASCDELTDSANIEIKGTLANLNSATRYFFPAQFETSPSGDISIDITWETDVLSSVSIGIQSKADAEASNTSFLSTDTNDINTGPGVLAGEFFSSTPYSIPASSSDLKIMPHAFVAYTDDASALSESFYANIKTVVQGWGDVQARMAGVSHGSELVAIKSLGSSGSGNISDVVRSLEYIAGIASTDNIIAVNLSFSISGMLTSEVLNEAVSSLISKGVAVVVSAGNEQENSYSINSPGIVSKAITVGAVNENNQVASYSSIGKPLQDVTKPDLLAPGGSSVSRNYIIAPKSTKSGSIWNRSSDISISQDPYALKVGTSQAAPMVAGLIGLMASKRNAVWDFTSDADLMFFKMLMCMTAFETGSRESDTFFLGAPIVPERAGGIKDRVEGYGRICVNGAMSALDDGLVTDTFTFGSNPYEAKSFARKIELLSSKEYNFSMAVPSGADFDLYLFSGTPDENGEPVLLASSALSNNPLESIVDFIPPATGTYYLVAKWIGGSGTSNFSLDMERSKPSTPTIISDLRIDRFMRDKKIAISWKTNLPSLSKIQYGNDGGLGEEKTSSEYKTQHYFDFDIDYDNYYYLRAISSSQGNDEAEISTAVSPVYRSSAYTSLERDISIEDLPIVPDIGGCGYIDNSSAPSASTYFVSSFIICLLPVFLLILFALKLRSSLWIKYLRRQS
jgi:hypothetical protein